MIQYAVYCVSKKGQLLKRFLQHEYESAHAEDEQLASVHLQCKCANTTKPEPIMFLSIIPSRSSQKFYPLFFQIPTLIFPVLLYTVYVKTFEGENFRGFRGF